MGKNQSITLSKQITEVYRYATMNELTASLVQAGHKTAVVVEGGNDKSVELSVHLQNGLDVNFGVVQSILKKHIKNQLSTRTKSEQ